MIQLIRHLMRFLVKQSPGLSKAGLSCLSDEGLKKQHNGYSRRYDVNPFKRGHLNRRIRMTIIESRLKPELG